MKKDFPHEPPHIKFTTVPPPSIPRSRLRSAFWGRVPPQTILNSQPRRECWTVASGVVIHPVARPSIPRLQASGNARVGKARTMTIALSGTFDPKVNRGRRNVRIITPPWHGLRNVVRVVAGRRFLKDVIEPTLADVHHEYYEAITDGNDRQARAIKWFGLVRIALVVLISPLLRLFEKLRSLAV